MLLDHVFPRETDRVKENNIPLVIVGGTVEYHGPHCSYGCDTLVAEGLVKKLAEKKDDDPANEEDAEIDALVAQRTQARKDKNWAEADRIRDELKAMGIVLEDTAQGVKWHRE
jgi:cysteinyl-tRNA synthetase